VWTLQAATPCHATPSPTASIHSLLHPPHSTHHRCIDELRAAADSEETAGRAAAAAAKMITPSPPHPRRDEMLFARRAQTR